jgi:hypothetical protein
MLAYCRGLFPRHPFKSRDSYFATSVMSSLTSWHRRNQSDLRRSGERESSFPPYHRNNISGSGSGSGTPGRRHTRIFWLDLQSWLCRDDALETGPQGLGRILRPIPKTPFRSCCNGGMQSWKPSTNRAALPTIPPCRQTSSSLFIKACWKSWLEVVRQKRWNMSWRDCISFDWDC